MWLAITRDLDIIETRRTRENVSNARHNGRRVGGRHSFTHVTPPESIYDNVFDLLSSGNSSSHN